MIHKLHLFTYMPGVFALVVKEKRNVDLSKEDVTLHIHEWMHLEMM